MEHLVRSWNSDIAHISAETKNGHPVTLCGRTIKVVDDLNLLVIENGTVGGEHGYRQCSRCGPEVDFLAVHKYHQQKEQEREIQRKAELKRATEARRAWLAHKRETLEDIAAVLGQQFEVRTDLEHNRVYVRSNEDLGWFLLTGTSFGPDDD